MASDAADLTFIRCPSCRSLVPAMSTRCRMCGYVLASDISTESRSVIGASPTKERDRREGMDAEGEDGLSVSSTPNEAGSGAQESSSQPHQNRQISSAKIDSADSASAKSDSVVARSDSAVARSDSAVARSDSVVARSDSVVARSDRVVREIADSSEGRIRIRTATEQDSVLTETVSRLRSTEANQAVDVNANNNKDLPKFDDDNNSDDISSLNPLGDYLLGDDDESSLEADDQDAAGQSYNSKKLESDYNDDSIDDLEIKKEEHLDYNQLNKAGDGATNADHSRVASERDRSKAFRLGGNTAFAVDRPEPQTKSSRDTIQTNTKDDEIIPKQFPFSEEPLEDPFSSNQQAGQIVIAETVDDEPVSDQTEAKYSSQELENSGETVFTSKTMVAETTTSGSQIADSNETIFESNGLHAELEEEELVNNFDDNSQLLESEQQHREGVIESESREYESISQGQHFSLDSQQSAESTDEKHSYQIGSDLFDRSEKIAESPNHIRHNLKEEKDTEKHLIGWLVSYDEPEGHSVEIREGKRFISSRLIKDGDLVIEDELVSAPHAMMNASLEGIKVQDLMSETGVFILRGNAKSDWRREEDVIRLSHGDWVRFGKVSYLVCLIPYNLIVPVSSVDPIRAE